MHVGRTTALTTGAIEALCRLSSVISVASVVNAFLPSIPVSSTSVSGARRVAWR